DKETKYYKYQYYKDDDVVTINFDSKEEVALKKQWVGTSQVQQMQNELDQTKKELNEVKSKLNESESTATELNEIKEKLNSANSTIESLTKEKEELETKFNETTEKIISLNSLI